MSKPYDFLLGRKTNEKFAAYWPNVKDDGASGINNASKYVVSETLEKPGWYNFTLIRGDIPIEIQKLKKQSGPDLQVHGSGKLIQTLFKHDLVDELWLKIYPLESIGQKLVVGNSVYLLVHPGSKEKANRIFSSLSAGGEIEMDISDQPWGDY